MVISVKKETKTKEAQLNEQKLDTHKGPEDWKIFSGIRDFVSKMSDCIKFQNHVPFNFIITLKLDFVYFVYCKE